jgi:hypothetical protein
MSASLFDRDIGWRFGNGLPEAIPECFVRVVEVCEVF